MKKTKNVHRLIQISKYTLSLINILNATFFIYHFTNNLNLIN